MTIKAALLAAVTALAATATAPGHRATSSRRIVIGFPRELLHMQSVSGFPNPAT